MGRKSNKSPEQQLAEAQAILERAKARVAKEESQSNPEMAKLADVLESIEKDIAKCSRESSGHNSFENRIKAAEARLAWIRVSSEYNAARMAEAQGQANYIRKEMGEAATKIANGEDIDADTIIGNMPTVDAVTDLAVQVAEADANWRSLTPSNLAKASQATPEITAAE